MQKPDVDHIDGLSPAISIEQKTTSKNPRSTVGTVTEIYDYLRLLFARVGVPYSPATGLPIESQTVHADGRPRAGAARGHAPLPAGADRARPQGRVPQGAGRAAEEGLPARQDQRRSSTRSPRRPSSTRNTSTTSTWWWTASSCARTSAPRLADSFETALELADGIAIAEYADKPLKRRPLPSRGERARVRGEKHDDGAEPPTPAPPRKGAGRAAESADARTRTSCATRTRRTSASRSRRALPARCPASPSTRSSRGCSRSTRRPAPAPSATGSAPRCGSRPTWWCPIRRSA